MMATSGNTLRGPGLAGTAWRGGAGIFLSVDRAQTQRPAARPQGTAALPAVLRFREAVGQANRRPAWRQAALFYALPYLALAATLFGLVIVPVPGHAVDSFPGDIILLLYLLEVPVICDVMAGYVSQSIYGQVSAMREAVMSLAYNLPLLAAVIAMAQNAGSFRIGTLQSAPFGVVTFLAVIAFGGGDPGPPQEQSVFHSQCRTGDRGWRAHRIQRCPAWHF